MERNTWGRGPQARPSEVLERSFPSREIAQAYLDRLYEDLALCAALRSALKATHAVF